jgi:thiol-disulfide isomerase/thioredoxin
LKQGMLSREPLLPRFRWETENMHGEKRTIWPLALAIGALLLLPIALDAAPKPAARPAPQAVDGAGLRKAIESNKGKVVVLNLWATWCQPCVEEFPNLVKLYNHYHDRGLVVLAAAVDEPGTRGKVRPFLVSQKARFPAYVRKSGDIDTFINAIDKNWGGAVPTTYFFDRNGKLVGKALVGGQSYATFAAAVEPLLK